MTINETAEKVAYKVNMLVESLLPTPTCPLKREQNKWKQMQVKNKVAELISTEYQSKGIKIEL